MIFKKQQVRSLVRIRGFCIFHFGKFLNSFFVIEKFFIGFMSNLFTLPPTFFLLQLFRRTHRRNTKTRRLKKLIKKREEKDQKQIKPIYIASSTMQSSYCSNKQKLTFPWWFKIIAYMASFFIMSVSILFIVFKG